MAGNVNIDNYYRVVSIQGNVIHVEIKGFWDDRIIDQIGPEFLRLYENAIKQLHGKRFITLADWSTCPVLGKKMIDYFSKAMLLVKRYNGHKVVEVIPKALAQIGVKAAAEQTGKDDFRIVVTSLAEAQKAIEQLKQELS
ncbi:hypothetical protein U27_01961 [Candidatus Vecturithrix granuli]|uniref:STAS domain-containing protein n=1 Tax=Vecturithrix granuli TaxID=1499967 RepID=A0A0S6WA64_VECG1|nr:hypothetical protein U27_01961 [Candidatus Vecturithrix granuli]